MILMLGKSEHVMAKEIVFRHFHLVFGAFCTGYFTLYTSHSYYRLLSSQNENSHFRLPVRCGSKCSKWSYSWLSLRFNSSFVSTVLLGTLPARRCEHEAGSKLRLSRFDIDDSMKIYTAGFVDHITRQLTDIPWKHSINRSNEDDLWQK